MRRVAFLVLVLVSVAAARPAEAQVGGNVGYGQVSGRAKAEQAERAKRQVTRDEAPPTGSSMYLDASVLINVRPDEYVATFGVAETAETVEGCHQKMDATIAAFTRDLRGLGVEESHLFVDLTAQTKIYGFKVEGNLAREQLTGFELKKTVAVRYRDRDLIDRLLRAASRHAIYDLVKVEAVVSDVGPVHERLAEAAAEVIKAKRARHDKLLGVRLRPVPQVIADRSSAYFPTEMYDSYVAGETEAVAGGIDRNQTTVQSLRKNRTFYYNPLTADGFDRVIDPVVLAPVVQFTLYLKLRYEIDSGR